MYTTKKAMADYNSASFLSVIVSVSKFTKRSFKWSRWWRCDDVATSIQCWPECEFLQRNDSKLQLDRLRRDLGTTAKILSSRNRYYGSSVTVLTAHIVHGIHRSNLRSFVPDLTDTTPAYVWIPRGVHISMGWCVETTYNYSFRSANTP